MSSGQETAKWVFGPPAPMAATIIARVLELFTFVLTAIWIFHNLGGVGFSPKIVLGPKKHAEEVTNDTGPVFNWHPLLMSLAFPVFMSEAMLAYRRPLAKDLDRGQRKMLHAALHSAAIFCIIFGIVAAFQSHSLKKPVPIPQLYSPHSYLGMLTFIMSLLQYLAGLGGFLLPKMSAPQRAALSPLHMYLGRATYVLGLATMTVGIQEKTTFIQMGSHLQGSALFRSYLRIPASLQLLIAFTGLVVLYHHAPGPTVKGEAAGDNGLLEGEVEDPEH